MLRAHSAASYGRVARRHAHISAQATPLSPQPAPPPPAYIAATLLDATPVWYSDPSYLARYRDPSAHDRRASRSKVSLSRTLASSSAPESKTVSLRTREEWQKRQQKNENGTPRSRRLEMERMWSGGEFSPPLPNEAAARVTRTVESKHAVLFPGSGSQYVSMGQFLKSYPAAIQVWDEAEEALAGFETWRKSLKLHEVEGEVGELGKMLDATEAERIQEKGLKDVVFDGPQDELTKSSNAQPAILITSIAFLRALEKDLASRIADKASFFLGHSSGEYSAAVASGAISLTDGVRLTRLHGLLTSCALSLPSISLSAAEDAPAASRAQMSALVINPGHSHQELVDAVKTIRAESDAKGSEGTVEIASFNSSAQVVLAGSRDGILRASEVLRERGIASRAADLPVSAPFHCSFMKPAAAGMQIALDSLAINKPTAPIVSGLDGELITTPASLISNLVSQIALPVRWSHCLSSLRHSDTSRLIFLGPGKALANLARRDAALFGEGEPQEVLSVATEAEMQKLKALWEDEQ